MTSATVGLLFSDIEGSTRLLQQLGPAYGEVLGAHHELLRAAFAQHAGEEQGNEGDSFFVTFASASDAVAAALHGQRSLNAYGWPPGVSVRVRMGVHVGEIQTVGGTIVGMSVHEAARISAAGHGGQVLVSTAAQAQGAAPDGTSWLDLGPHRLKDIDSPMQLFQLLHPDLPTGFPPLRSRGAGRNNLPSQASSFIGRAREVAEIEALLPSARLLTLTGAGGSGKSRIALRVAADQGSRFNDGVWFVDLAPISDAAAVPQQIASALEVPETSSSDLASAIGARRLLLVIDNCEHVLVAVADVIDDLLRRCPGVGVLATSREPLGAAGEVIWRVPSLAPDDAVTLFSTRARAVSSTFAVSDVNQAAVDDVCERLDAIPLALELAAARLGSLTVEQLSSRLDQRFRLLAGGARGAMARQRTLQATVDWSYDLLDAPEQRMLRRLGAFVGGFTLDAAEGLCADIDTVDVLLLVDQLVAKSLVVAEETDGAIRYRLLETIRHYAVDRLVQAGEIAAARDAHVHWLECLAHEAEPALWFGEGDGGHWLAELDREDGNLRAGMEWALEGGQVSVATSILFDVSVWLIARGRSREGLDWARRLLAAGGTAQDRALLTFDEMSFASNAGALEPAMIDRVQQCAGGLTSSPRRWVEPLAQGYAAAWSYDSGDPQRAAQAIPACERAVDASRQFAPAVVGLTLQPLMWAHVDAGNLDAARACGEEALTLTAAAGLTIGESRMSVSLARIAVASGDLDAAWRHAERAVEVARRTGDTFVIIAGTTLLADVAERRGEVTTARDLLASILDAVAETQTDEELATLRARIASSEPLPA